MCKQYSKPLFNTRKYTLFDFYTSIFIYLGILRFNLAGYVKLNALLYTKFCERKGSLTAEAGLVPSITMELQAGATGNLLVGYTKASYYIAVCSIVEVALSMSMSLCYYTLMLQSLARG